MVLLRPRARPDGGRRPAALSRAGAADAGLAVAFVVLWSSGFVGSELGTQSADAFTLLTWRMVVAVPLLSLWLRHSVPRDRRASRRDLGAHAAVGALAQGVYLGGVLGAVAAGVPTGTTALVAALQPIVVGVLAGPVLGETVRRRQWGGLAVGAAGVALVVGDDLRVSGATPVWAYALPVIGMLGLVAGTLLERRLAPQGTLVETLRVQCLAAGVLFAAVAVALGDAGPPEDARSWLAVVWLAVLSTIGGYATYWLNVSRGSVTRVSSLLYLTPPTTMLWAAFMFGEPVGPVALAGLAVCGLAVALVRTGPRAGSASDDGGQRRGAPEGDGRDPADDGYRRDPGRGPVRRAPRPAPGAPWRG